MNNIQNVTWQTGLPLTFSEREGRKATALVRASVRIAIFRQPGGVTECLFVSHPTKGLEVPGGAIDPDEDPYNAALRELAEETGLKFDATYQSVHLAGFVPITDQHNGRWLDIVYTAEVSATDLNVDSQAAEFPVSWLDVNELEKRLSTNAQLIVNCALNARTHPSESTINVSTFPNHNQ